MATTRFFEPGVRQRGCGSCLLSRRFTCINLTSKKYVHVEMGTLCLNLLLTGSQTIEGDWSLNKRINEFETRLNTVSTQEQGPKGADAGRRGGKIEVVRHNVGSGSDYKASSAVPYHHPSTREEGADTHRWLNSTGRFADAMSAYWNSLKAAQGQKSGLKAGSGAKGPAGKVEEDVVVALIDDGVDRLDNRAFHGRVLEGKSFDFHNGRHSPYFTSTRGHGTVMASMILRVCPMAKIYPIRLKTYADTMGRTPIDLEYAAKVRHDFVPACEEF